MIVQEKRRRWPAARHSRRPGGWSAVTLTALLLTVASPALHAQSGKARHRPLVLVTLPSTPSGEPAVEAAAGRFVHRVVLLLRLHGGVTVKRADFLPANVAFAKALAYYHEVDAARAVFGRVRRNPGGGYAVHLDVWRRSGKKGTITRLTRVVRPAAWHQASDRLALAVASKIVGKKLQYGVLRVRNAASLKQFSIYADGQLLVRNRMQVHVLTGRHQIIVARPGPLGDEPLQTFRVRILAGRTTTVSLRAAHAARASSSLQKSRASSTKGGVTATGGLRITSRPSGATVFLDRRPLGTTPLNLFGVPVGTYILRVKHRYFYPDSQVVKVQAGERATAKVTMTLDPNDAAVKARLVSPTGAAVTSLGWTAAQLSFLAFPLLDHSFLNYFAGGLGSTGSLNVPALTSYLVDAMFLRVGQRYAGNRGAARTLNIVDAAAAGVAAAGVIGLRLAPQSFQRNHPALDNALFTAVNVFEAVAPILSDVYDAATAPTAAIRENRRLLSEISRTGTIPPRQKQTTHPVIVETGGGSILRGGYRFRLIPSYLALETTLGLSALELTPFRPAATSQLRLSVTPFGRHTGRVRPVIFASLTGETDFSQLGLSVGGGIGVDFLLGPFDLFTRSGYRFGLINGLRSGTFTVGGRF